MIDCLTRDPIVALGRGPEGWRQATLSAPNFQAKESMTVSPFRLELVLIKEASERHGGEGAMRPGNDQNSPVNLAGYPRPARLGLFHLALIVSILASVVIANW
jgi:hypothetical protein